MLIPAVDSRTSRYAGRPLPSANSLDIPDPTASGSSATDLSGVDIASSQGLTGLSTTTLTISNPVASGSVVYGANSTLISGRLEMPVQSAADDPPKAVSNDDLSRALEAARTRGRALVARLLGGKDMLTTDEFGKLIGVTRDTMNQKRKRQEILALKGTGRGTRFPKWQVGKDGKPFRALPELFDRLGGDPWTVYRFLVQHHPELNGLTGVEALQRGQMEQVIDAAESTMRASS